MHAVFLASSGEVIAELADRDVVLTVRRLGRVLAKASGWTLR